MSEARETLGLYVHVPFCEAKCTYCHFAIDPRRPDDARQERYTQALLTEIAQAALPEGHLPPPADTLYFGGGTPSLLSADRLGRTIEAIGDRFDLDPSAEITLEANPRDLALEGYGALRSLGVGRLSLGLQSVDDAVLRDMGRLHTGDDGRLAVDLARRAGFANISVDLILGWPGETAERWQRNLGAVLAVGPEHVSLYVLEIDGKTLLEHRSRRGGLHLPDDDLVADLYKAAVDALGEAGIERYEISNFARPGFEARHNSKYWDDLPFLGFGMSAHSYRDGRRWWNVATYGGYCKGVEAEGRAIESERRLTPREHIGEALFTGLRRREGVETTSFAERFGVDPLAEYGARLSDAFGAGLLVMDGTRLRLTEAGVLLSNEVFRVFV
jgi:oxygen-independent coproporphyrinogen-3 oxidase